MKNPLDTRLREYDEYGKQNYSGKLVLIRKGFISMAGWLLVQWCLMAAICLVDLLAAVLSW